MKGIYVLIIQVNEPIRVKVGALGEISFETGLYAYVGSAQNNLELRIQRHFRKEKRLFWHIDYLLTQVAAEVTEVYALQGDKTHECQIAQLLSQQGKPITHFGCSDCHCASHLFCLENINGLKHNTKLVRFASFS